MKVYIKSFAISIGVTLALFLVLAVLLAKTSLNENFMQIGIVFISSICILIGGYFIGKEKKTKGLIYGGIFGGTYMLLFYVISSILNFNFAMSLETILMILAGVMRRNNRWDFRSKFIKFSIKSS